MNAREAAIVAVIISRNGCSPIPIEVAAIIGIKIVAMAVFDVISVNMAINKAVSITMRGRGISFSTASEWPIHSAKPVT